MANKRLRKKVEPRHGGAKEDTAPVVDDTKKEAPTDGEKK